MKFTVTWTEERHTTIDVANMQMADAWGKTYVKRMGPTARLLSIYEGVPDPPSPLPLLPSYSRSIA